MSEEGRGGHREQLQEFLESNRSETCLWKTKSKDYHDRDKKNAAYNRLVETYKAKDPKANRDLVVKKINNLRTTYKKELNKIKKTCKSGAGSDENYTPRLWYFEFFLYDQEVPRSSISNIDEAENEKQSTASIGSTSNERDTPTPNRFKSDRNTPTLNYSDSERATPTPNRFDSDQNTSTLNYSDSERDEPTPNRSDTKGTTLISSRGRLRPGKNTLTEDVLKSVNEYFKRPKLPDNRFEVFGKNVGMKLQELPKEQRIIAEKIIYETLFLAEMGSLTMSHTVRINDNFANTSFFTQPRTQNHYTQPHTQSQYPLQVNQHSFQERALVHYKSSSVSSVESTLQPDHDAQSDNTIKLLPISVIIVINNSICKILFNTSEFI